MEQKIYLASDHAGFELKEAIKQSFGPDTTVVDFGSSTNQPGDDYPDFAQKVCQAVLADPGSKGILICDTGIGMSIAANRYKGIRGALVTSSFLAKRSREHEDANILCLGQDAASESDNLAFTREWLATPFSQDERHKRRMAKVDMLS